MTDRMIPETEALAMVAAAAENREQVEIWAHEIIVALGFADVLKITSYDDNIEAHDTVGRELVEIIRALTPADAKAALDRLLRDAENRGLERAAKVADECERQNGPLSGTHFEENYRRGLEAGGQAIAAAIRAMKEPTE